MALAAVQSKADPAAKPKKLQPEGWSTSFSAGLNLTRGNSKNLLVNGSFLEKYNRGDNIFRLDIQGNYGESVTGTNNIEQTNVQNARGVAEYKRLVSERDYGYANAALSHDQIAGVDYRGIAGPGVGRYFFKGDSMNLNAEMGVAYICQRLSGQDGDNVIHLRLAQRFETKLLATSKLWESLEYLPAIDDFDNYLVYFEMGASAAMTTHLNLRVVFQDQFDSRPAAGKEKNDMQLIAGIGCQL